MTRFVTKVLALALASSLTACSLPTRQYAPDEQPVIVGPAVRSNVTPLDTAFVCLANAMRQKNQPPIAIAVGDVKDYTGKYSQNEGSAITQGGALMIYSALGKMGNVVQLQERFDTRIAELELAYTDRRQLGDGRTYTVEAGKPAVPWVPYFGGTILRSQYYIVGGITEVNYNIQSGGFEASVNLVGGKARTYTMNVGVDLRIIDTRTLVVAKTVSMQKQIRGQEVGLGVYRFFNDKLLDLNIGTKNQEPLQLAVRTSMEHGVLELMAAISGLDANDCIAQSLEPKAEGSAAKALALVTAPLAAVKAKFNGNGNSAAMINSDSTQSGLVAQNAGLVGQGSAYEIEFDTASTGMSPQAMSQLESMVTQTSQGQSLTFHLLSRDSENFAPQQRRELTLQRIKAVSDRLVARGIQSTRISVNWQPAATDYSITRHGSGLQRLATLAISK